MPVHLLPVEARVGAPDPRELEARGEIVVDEVREVLDASRRRGGRRAAPRPACARAPSCRRGSARAPGTGAAGARRGRRRASPRPAGTAAPGQTTSRTSAAKVPSGSRSHLFASDERPAARRGAVKRPSGSGRPAARPARARGGPRPRASPPPDRPPSRRGRRGRRRRSATRFGSQLSVCPTATAGVSTSCTCTSSNAIIPGCGDARRERVLGDLGMRVRERREERRTCPAFGGPTSTHCPAPSLLDVARVGPAVAALRDVRALPPRAWRGASCEVALELLRPLVLREEREHLAERVELLLVPGRLPVALLRRLVLRREVRGHGRLPWASRAAVARRAT